MSEEIISPKDKWETYRDYKSKYDEERKRHDEWKFEQSLFPPRCEDAESIVMLPEAKLCGKCGLPAPILKCDVKECNTYLNYKMQRLRVVTKCDSCGNIDTYRLGWKEINSGEYVRKR